MFFKKSKRIKELESKLAYYEGIDEFVVLREKEIEKYSNARKQEEEEFVAQKKQEVEELNKEKESLLKEIEEKKQEVEETKKAVNKEIQLLDEIEANNLFLDIDLEEPEYDFKTSTIYREELGLCRNKQKKLVENEGALSLSSEAKEYKTVASYKEYDTDRQSELAWVRSYKQGAKLTLRCFNAECKMLTNKLTVKNYQKSKERLRKIFTTINKINYDYLGIQITERYYKLKEKELSIIYSYLIKKAEEKEIMDAQREREREEKALQKEIESKRKLINKDMTHYKNIIAELEKKLNTLESEVEKRNLLLELERQKHNLQYKEEELEDLDYRAANATAGYVYIISNIGSFGKGIVKIGVTRRLDPMERINELGSASVPFKFDVHALIFSEDAFKLEKELHDHFTDYRVNKVNLRKEFFRVPMGKIEKKLNEYKNLAIGINKVPEAKEYYQTLEIEKEIKGK